MAPVSGSAYQWRRFPVQPITPLPCTGSPTLRRCLHCSVKATADPHGGGSIAITRITTHNKRHQPNPRDSGNQRCQAQGSQSKASNVWGLCTPFQHCCFPLAGFPPYYGSTYCSPLLQLNASPCLVPSQRQHLTQNSNFTLQPPTCHVHSWIHSRLLHLTFARTSQHPKSPVPWARRVEHPETKKVFPRRSP